MHADWQALHPMHRETSMSFATSRMLRAAGEENIVAELLIMSDDCCAIAFSYAF
jgi:hypothetical protein